jgi:hypothetical protein
MNHKKIITPYLITIFILLCNGVTTMGDETSKKFYATYATLLATYVSPDGLVDYAGLLAERSAKNKASLLERGIANVQSLDEKKYRGFDDDQKVAFWINAYNLFTLKAIVYHYPIKAKGTSALIYPKKSIEQIFRSLE